MEAAAQQGMSAAQQKAVGEMLDAASDKIAQKVVAGLEERVKSLEAALENYEQENRLFFAARDISLMENQAEQDAALVNKMADLIKDTVKAETQAVESNIAMQMADMQGAIEQIRDNDKDVSSDDGLYSDDEEEEDKGAGATYGEEGAEASYGEVEALCLATDTGEFRKLRLHLQAVARAGREGQFDEGELQAVFNLRADREQEKPWSLAEAQRGLVQMGSSTTVAGLAAAGQRAADGLTREQYARIQKEAEDTMKTLVLKQKQVEYEREKLMK